MSFITTIMEEPNLNNTKKIAYSGIVMALYVLIVFITQSFAYGQYQIRIATGLYALAFHFPFLVIPLALANMLSNLLMGGLGVFDIVGGFLIGLITAGGIALLGKKTKNAFILVLPIAIVPAVIVPIWLSYILGISYFLLVLSLLVGQVVSAYTIGLLVIKNKWLTGISNSY